MNCKIKYSRDGVVAFDAASHTYTHTVYNKELISSTRYLSQVFPEFEREKIAEEYGRKNGLKTEDVLKKWEADANNGTFAHLCFETFDVETFTDFLDKPAPKMERLREHCRVYPKINGCIKFIEDNFMTGALTPVDREVIVYNNNYAGQVDMIVRDRKGYLITLDWKTNNSISTMNYDGRYIAGDYGARPATTLNKYFMQQLIYKRLMAQIPMYAHLHIAAQYLVHITAKGYKVIHVKDDYLEQAIIKNIG